MCLALAGGCAAQTDAADKGTSVSNDIAAAAVLAEPGDGSYTADIRLSAGEADIRGTGAALSDGELRITQSGCYRLAGELDGCVTVDCSGEVELVLCGLRIRGGGWAIYAKSCKALTLTLTEDFGQSYLSQTSTAEENGVCLESKAPLTIRGSGLLTLQAAGVGLRGAGAVRLEGGALTVNAGGAGIKAKSGGSIAVSGGSLTVRSGDDALKAPYVAISGGTVSLEAEGRGVDAGEFALTDGTLSVSSGSDGIRTETLVSVSGGSAAIEAGRDGIQSEGDVEIGGGTLSVLCAGGGGNALQCFDSGGVGGPGWGSSSGEEYYVLPDYSCKAVKADGGIRLLGGALDLSSADDAVHAAGAIEIADVYLTICSSDDAVHSDTDLTIDSGTILISDCFEGLEAGTITINGGDIDIYSVNDGINASSKTDSGGFGWGSSAVFTMNGGEVDIFVTGSSSNMGDGVDSNGAIYINGGRITAGTDGSTMENGIDSGSSFVVTGGILAASGNAGMQESASTYSTQCAAVLELMSGVQAGTECVVTDEDGNVVMTYTPYRWCTCIVLSHPDFQIGRTYTLTAGSQTKTFTFTSVSYSERGFGGFGGPSF